MVVVHKKITDKNGTMYEVSSTDELAVGEVLEVVSAEEAGTEEQNKLFHALLGDIYRSRAWSFGDMLEYEQDNMTLAEFKIKVKMEYGKGAEYYTWVDRGGRPQVSRKKPDFGEAQYCFAIPKSWLKYTKNERSKMIDQVLAWADAIGVSAQVEKYRRELVGVHP